MMMCWARAFWPFHLWGPSESRDIEAEPGTEEARATLGALRGAVCKFAVLSITFIFLSSLPDLLHLNSPSRSSVQSFVQFLSTRSLSRSPTADSAHNHKNALRDVKISKLKNSEDRVTEEDRKKTDKLYDKNVQVSWRMCLWKCLGT